MGATPAIGAVPVPLRGTVKVGFTGSLPLIVRLALRAPVTAGVNVTLMVQFAPIPRLAPHPLVWAKSARFVTMLLMMRGAVPVLDRVTVCAALAVFRNWFPKASVGGATPAMGAMPVPLKVTVNVGCKGSSLVTVKPADRAPLTVGRKVTLTVQVAPWARLAPHPLVIA